MRGRSGASDCSWRAGAVQLPRRTCGSLRWPILLRNRLVRRCRHPASIDVPTPAVDCEPSVTIFRRFKNTDPPALAEVWNESHTSRGAYPLRTPGLFERWIFSKPYFDPDGLILAVDEATNRVQGYVLAGFAPTEDLSALSYEEGVICGIAVRPADRRKGIGRELVARIERYLA